MNRGPLTPLTYQSAPIDDPAHVPWRTVARLVGGIALLWGVVQLLFSATFLFGPFLSRGAVARWSSSVPSSAWAMMEAWTHWGRLLAAAVTCIAAAGLVMLRAYARRTLLVAISVLLALAMGSAITPFFGFWWGPGMSSRGLGSLPPSELAPLVVQMGLGLLSATLLPALMLGLLTRPPLVAALRSSGEELPMRIQLLAILVLLAGVLGTLIKPVQLLAARMRDALPPGTRMDQPYGITSLGSGLVATWYSLTRVALWCCAAAMVVGAIGVLGRRPGARRLLVWQARIGLVINGVDLVLSGTLFWILHPLNSRYGETMSAVLVMQILSLGLDTWILLALGRKRAQALFEPHSVPLAQAVAPATPAGPIA